MRERNYCEKTGDISNSESGEIYNLSASIVEGILGRFEFVEIASVVYRLVACCFYFGYCHSHSTIYKHESADASVNVSKIYQR